jgi:hypothetical protein
MKAVKPVASFGSSFYLGVSPDAYFLQPLHLADAGIQFVLVHIANVLPPLPACGTLNQLVSQQHHRPW